MDLLKIINNKTIIYPLKSISKADAMQELLDYFYHLDYLTSTIKLLSYLDDQEKEFNSASGRGVAYHYHTSIEINETLAVLGISKEGVDYNAADGMLCHFILLILEPKDEPNKHRILINLFQNLIKDSKIKSQLLDINSSNEAEDIIKEWQNQNNISDDLL